MSKYLELVEGSFTQEHLDKQMSQKPYVAYSIKDGKVIYTIVPKEEEDMWIITVVELKDISNCTYNMVDLGLPSGLKWADRNVGATSPEDFGSYFQWGEIVRDKDGKPTSNAYTYNKSAEITTEQLVNLLNLIIGGGVTTDNVKDLLESEGITNNDLRNIFPYILSIDKTFNLDDYFDTSDGGNTFNKYNKNGGLRVLESVDDATANHMGTEWRMPTEDEIRELIRNTTLTFIDLDGNEYVKWTDTINIELGRLKGVRFTGPNGNSIFIPAAGYCTEMVLQYIGTIACTWSASLGVRFDGHQSSCLSADIITTAVTEAYQDCSFGLPIRGVTL